MNTFGTGKYPDEAICKACLEIFNLHPAAIIEKLCLRNADYEKTASYGHFTGYNTWEDTLSVREDVHLEELVKKYVD
ncbi:MAG: methionine adenosyltransferase domain-containing protein [Bacillota bacterium]|nr:methionine adenosyltransferase domain-containing protein [Bacillota bacterium]